MLQLECGPCCQGKGQKPGGFNEREGNFSFTEPLKVDVAAQRQGSAIRAPRSWPLC